jgi:hypothetical protein
MAIKYEDAKQTTPSPGSRHHGTERPKYPSTADFASSKEEFSTELHHCIKARRPGGEYRKGHGFKTISCSCGSHPCKCGTHVAKEHIIHCDINE